MNDPSTLNRSMLNTAILHDKKNKTLLMTPVFQEQMTRAHLMGQCLKKVILCDLKTLLMNDNL